VENPSSPPSLPTEPSGVRAAAATVGAVVEWDLVPPGTLVLESRTALLTVRLGDLGMCVGNKNDPGVEPFEERFAWMWEGQGGPCTILALGLTGDESGAELAEMAKRGSP